MNPSVIKVLSLDPIALKVSSVMAEIIRDMSTTVHRYFNFQGWHHGSCDQSEQGNNRQEKISQNPAMSLGLSLSKFIHVTVYETSFKKIIAPEQNNIVMSKMSS